MITSENYREIYEELVEETDDFTSESGVVKCTTKKASDIIREILSNYYNIIDYGISDIEEVDGNVYMVIYNDRNDEELSFEEEEPLDEPEEIEEVPDDIELPEDENTVQESLSLIESYLTEGIEESKSFVSEALKQHPEFRELIKAGAWKALQERVYKYYPQDDIKSESAWGKFLEVLDKSGVKYKIDSIPEYCFRNSDITSFRIPEGTTEIGMCAFERCYNLTSIEIPDSVTDISYRAFWSCTSLTEIKLPASLEIVGPEAFRNCKNWKGDVVIPDTCYSIMDRAFMKCASLNSITVPYSVVHIGPDCFKECNLKSIILPDIKYKYNPYAKKIGINGMPKKSIIITESLVEKIVKKGSKWQVQSEKGRNMGTYSTKKEAEERLRQVEYFKHKNESIDDNFKLQHSLLEDIPTFWEWVDDQGLDPDVIEENPDLEEYFRQQYDITYNFKTPEDYDLLDTDVPDDYDDFDFYHHEEELPGYHYVCYFDDDDKDEDDSGDVDTLEKAIEVCDNLRATKGYDCAEIFGPKGDTVATFWEGKWNTNYGESLNETLSGLKVKKKLDLLKELKKNPNYKEDPRWEQFEDELINVYRLDPSEADIDTALYYTEFDWIDANLAMESLGEDKLKFSPNYDPAGTPLGKGTGLGEDYYDEENEVMIYSCPNCGADLEWLGTQGKYEEYKCPECGEYFYDESGKLINSAEIEESLDEGARSGIHQVSLQLNLLKELKKNPNYKEDPRWERYDGIYDNIDEVIADLNDELFDLRQDRKWESLNEGYDKYEKYIKKVIIEKYGRKFYNAMVKARDYDDVWEAVELIDGEDIQDDIGTVVDWCQYKGQVPYYDVLGEIVNEFELDDNYNESLNEENELEFSPNYNPAGTPLGKGTGLGEELDDEEPSLECLNCGCDTEWLGTQGDLEEFKCPECGEYYYLTKDGRIVGEKAFSESLTEALIDRDMDTIKKSDLLKAPVGSVLKVKFNERPNNNWIDAYLKVDGDNWAVLNDAGDIDRDYDLLNSQTLYFSFIDSFDEMTEFEIDTAPNKKYNFNLTEAVIDFYNNNIKKQYSRFCDIYERAFEKIPNLKIKVINRSYVAEKTINSSGASASIGILGGDSDGTFFELRLDPEASDSFATYYIDKDGNVSVESTIYGNIVELCHLFDKNKDRLIDLITPLFNAAYDKLSEAIKNAGFKLGESLTEAKNDTLNPAIWENNELKPEVKEKLELIVDKFKDRLKEDGVDIDIDDVIIVGSNANYNYTDKSDIDLHLVADLSIYKDKEDLAQVVYNAYRRLFNDKFDPMIYGHEVELYIEPKE